MCWGMPDVTDEPNSPVPQPGQGVAPPEGSVEPTVRAVPESELPKATAPAVAPVSEAFDGPQTATDAMPGAEAKEKQADQGVGADQAGMTQAGEATIHPAEPPAGTGAETAAEGAGPTAQPVSQPDAAAPTPTATQTSQPTPPQFDAPQPECPHDEATQLEVQGSGASRSEVVQPEVPSPEASPAFESEPPSAGLAEAPGSEVTAEQEEPEFPVEEAVSREEEAGVGIGPVPPESVEPTAESTAAVSEAGSPAGAGEKPAEEAAVLPSGPAEQRVSERPRKPAAEVPREPTAEEPKSDKMDWYILKVQSNREESIREGLLRRVAIAGLQRYFGDVIIPTEKVTEFKGGKKRVTKRKLYPGYLVVQMEINDDTWFLVRETPGIGDFTGAGGRPTPMQPHEVARILAKAEEKTDEVPKLKIGCNVGDRVKINEGTFVNFEGDVESIDYANGRVTVMINIFGRSTPVELEYWQIETV